MTDAGLRRWLADLGLGGPHHIERLPGATSSTVLRVTTTDTTLVIRQFTSESWFREEPDLLEREAAVLNALDGTTLPVPALIGRAPPPLHALAMTCLPGRAVVPRAPGDAWLDALAEQLVAIHQCGARFDHDFRSWTRIRRGPTPDAIGNPDLWRAIVDIVAHPPDVQRRVPLHRDYHPLNVLWEGNRITGVVDWINAVNGDPAVDLAHCRLNLALMYGVSAADGFLECYRRRVPAHRQHPYWDLDAALSTLPAPKPYSPWAAFGLGNVTPQVHRSRYHIYLTHLVSG